jgi:hypothetical protein
VTLEQAFRLVKTRLDLVMCTGSYSLGLVKDIAVMVAQDRHSDPFSILDEISALEGSRRSATKSATAFKGRHLRGHWHKHYEQPAFMPRNLLNEMVRDDTVARLLSPHVGEQMTPEILARLLHAVVKDNYFRRRAERRLTGEWIIFSKKRRTNHYLALANHLEDDAVIAKRVHGYEDIDKKTGWNSRGHSDKTDELT